MTFARKWLLIATLAPAVVTAQSTTREKDVNAAIDRLFDAMRASDTAATRSAFLPTGRVIPIQLNATGPGLSIDQFVAFTGKNAPGTWIERVWNPTQRNSGPLVDLWFEYDVYRGATFDHCGVNSVQLQDTGSGWKIVTMAFTSVAQGCPTHPPPK